MAEQLAAVLILLLYGPDEATVHSAQLLSILSQSLTR
jgi:hypothetical protein